MHGAPIRKCVRVDLNTQNDMSVGPESLFHFFGNLQPPFPSPWHLVAIVRNSQQRRIIFFLNPIGSDRWRWPVLKVVHMSHPTNVVIGSACCWARAVGCKASALPSPAMNSGRRISHVSEPLYGEQSIATTGTASGIRGEIPSIFFAAREAGRGPTCHPAFHLRCPVVGVKPPSPRVTETAAG
jgi:hypothetical protein